MGFAYSDIGTFDVKQLGQLGLPVISPGNVYNITRTKLKNIKQRDGTVSVLRYIDRYTALENLRRIIYSRNRRGASVFRDETK